MKIYILQYSDGEYEDFRTHIYSAHIDPSKADEFKRKLLASVESAKAEPCPIDEDILDDPRWYEKCSDEIFESHQAWQTRVNEANDFNSAWITELETDQIINP